MSPTIAVLALQGAFIEHEQRLQSLGCTTIEPVSYTHLAVYKRQVVGRAVASK